MPALCNFVFVGMATCLPTPVGVKLPETERCRSNAPRSHKTHTPLGMQVHEDLAAGPTTLLTWPSLGSELTNLDEEEGEGSGDGGAAAAEVLAAEAAAAPTATYGGEGAVDVHHRGSRAGSAEFPAAGVQVATAAATAAAEPLATVPSTGAGEGPAGLVVVVGGSTSSDTSLPPGLGIAGAPAGLSSGATPFGASPFAFAPSTGALSSPAHGLAPKAKVRRLAKGVQITYEPIK